MSHFVLIHGTSHKAWCWYKLRCLMETSGYVTCLDLTSSNIDPTDASTIFTFKEYNKPLPDFLLNRKKINTNCKIETHAFIHQASMPFYNISVDN